MASFAGRPGRRIVRTLCQQSGAPDVACSCAACARVMRPTFEQQVATVQRLNEEAGLAR